MSILTCVVALLFSCPSIADHVQAKTCGKVYDDNGNLIPDHKCKGRLKKRRKRIARIKKRKEAEENQENTLDAEDSTGQDPALVSNETN